MRLTPALVVLTLALSLACGRPGKEGDGGGLFGDDTGDGGTGLPQGGSVARCIERCAGRFAHSMQRLKAAKHEARKDIDTEHNGMIDMPTSDGSTRDRNG